MIHFCITTDAFLFAFITIALSCSKWETPQPQCSPQSLSLCTLSHRANSKALQFLKRCRAQSQISAQVLIWPPNGIIQTQAFITHMNERAEPGHPCSRTRPPTKSKEGWKSGGLKEWREKGKRSSVILSSTLHCFHLLRFVSALISIPYSILIRPFSCLTFPKLQRLDIYHLKVRNPQSQNTRRDH